jgi:hypothetical protein
MTAFPPRRSHEMLQPARQQAQELDHLVTGMVTLEEIGATKNLVAERAA